MVLISESKDEQMRSIKTVVAVLALSAFAGSGLYASGAEELAKEAMKLDVKKVCDVKANGLKKVLAVAQKYNPAAVELGVEFKRLGITNSVYIQGLKEAVAKNQKSVTLKYKSKGKVKTKTFPTDYATWRACTFAVRALQLHEESKKTWRLAVPGDGFKF